MGGVLSVASTALCCACTGVTCACSLVTCCFSTATAAAGGISNTAAKLFYLVDLGLLLVLCLVLRYSADDWNWEFAGYEVGCSNSTNQQNLDVFNQTGSPVYAYCAGDGAVFRACAAATIFFALQMLLAALSPSMHRGLWFWKLLVHIGLTVGFMFLDNDAFDQSAFVWAARALSVLFFLVQLLLLVGFAYDWNDTWLRNSESAGRSERLWLGLIIAAVVLLYVGTLAGIVVLYLHFSDCSIGKGVTSVTLIASLVVTVLMLFRDKYSEEPGALLPAAVVCAYATYLAWAALEANPDLGCKPYPLDSAGGDGIITVGVLFLYLGLAWGAMQGARSASSLMQGGRGVEEGVAATADAAPSMGGLYEVGGGRTGDDLRREQQQPEPASAPQESALAERLSLVAFHAVMAITCMYLAMVLTNWAASENVTPLSGGRGQMWLRISCQWLTFLLFTWTIVAPAVCSGRDFSGAPSKAAATSAARPAKRPAAQSDDNKTGTRHIAMV